jgi:DNA-binding CsgD family transcriptional regulator
VPSAHGAAHARAVVIRPLPLGRRGKVVYSLLTTGWMRGIVDQVLLWFNMISFTLMFASAGLSYIVYSRSPSVWLRDYLIYAFAHAVWLLFATWVFFQEVFLSSPLPNLSAVFAYARAAVSIVIIAFGPSFYLRTAGVVIRGRTRLFVVGVVCFVALSLIAILAAPPTPYSSVLSVLYNAYLAAVSWLAYAKLAGRRRAPQRPMLPFLLFSGVAYTILTALSSVLPFVVPPAYHLYPNVVAAGAFLCSWAVLVSWINLRWIGVGGSSEEAVPEAFSSDHGITPREEQILRLLVQGKTSKEIAGDLFISQRTVEAHLRNVYRKTGAGNRVELMNRLGAYRGSG